MSFFLFIDFLICNNQNWHRMHQLEAYMHAVYAITLYSRIFTTIDICMYALYIYMLFICSFSENGDLHVIDEKLNINRPIFPLPWKIKKIACGMNHVLFLNTIGNVYTQGLGR